MVSGGNSVYARSGHPLSVTGSLSSIVHSEEEVAGSYNWDYLLDWGPQYQPLAHVFHEISALKDEGGAGPQEPARVPPIITCRPPRHVHAPGSGLVPDHALAEHLPAGRGGGGAALHRDPRPHAAEPL